MNIFESFPENLMRSQGRKLWVERNPLLQLFLVYR